MAWVNCTFFDNQLICYHVNQFSAKLEQSISHFLKSHIYNVYVCILYISNHGQIGLGR